MTFHFSFPIFQLKVSTAPGGSQDKGHSHQVLVTPEPCNNKYPTCGRRIDVRAKVTRRLPKCYVHDSIRVRLTHRRSGSVDSGSHEWCSGCAAPAPPGATLTGSDATTAHGLRLRWTHQRR